LQVRVLSPLPLHQAQQHEEATTNVISGIRRYVSESWSELRKVAWPTRETVGRLTVLVIAVSIAVGVYIFVLDRVFNTLVEQVL
jgi:preprotein translocase subunit SecE